MPVFVSSPEIIIALHIGWRGLMQKIFTACCSKVANWNETKVFIGPHIKSSHFQLNRNFTKNLLLPHNLTIGTGLKKNLLKKSFDQFDHFYVDLEGILREEIKKIAAVEINTSAINTYSSPYHYSHRRNSRRVGQNYSFIVKQ